jgi:pimeloyl-ACP methyl ester carboxylesterase
MNKTITVNNQEIFYRVEGNGRPVMFVHGFGETGDVWKNQVAFFRGKYKMIIPDLPGSGKSALIKDMSMEGMASVLEEIVQEELPSAAAEKLVMIGHSMGGYITLAYAEKYPDQLQAFGLFHSTAYPDNEEKKATRRKGIGFIRENGAFEFLRTTSPNLFSPGFKAENQALVDSFIQGLNNFSPESLVYYYEAMIERPDRTDLLKNAKIPVLFILGEHDTAILLQDTLKLCSLPEKAYIHILRKSGHMGMIEEADLSNEILKNFFDGAWIF